MAHNNAVKQITNSPASKRNPVESIKQRVSDVASELLSQVSVEFLIFRD